MLNIDELIKTSLKNKDSVALRVFRNLKTEVMVFKTQKNAPEYNEAAELKIIQKYVAKLEDVINQYSDTAGEELILEYREELDILKKLLPAPISAQSIEDFVEHYCDTHGYIIGATNQIPKKDMGIVIKAAKEKYPTADGKMISEIVKKFVV